MGRSLRLFPASALPVTLAAMARGDKCGPLRLCLTSRAHGGSGDPERWRMTLKTLFAIPIAVILIVSLSLAGMIAGQGWSGQERGKAAVEAVARMRLLIALQTDLRAERIVTNLRAWQAVSDGGRRRATTGRVHGGTPIGGSPMSPPACAPPPRIIRTRRQPEPYLASVDREARCGAGADRFPAGQTAKRTRFRGAQFGDAGHVRGVPTAR